MSDTTAGTDGPTAPSSNDDDDVRVVLESTLLTCPEVFVYRIPPMMTSGGHRAEDWNLASPLETCSLVVKRVDSACFLDLMSEKPKPDGPPGATEPHLFAKCHIALDFDDETKKIEHWVEAVVDSSRYSVIRISDDRTGREAHIGMGFRERNDAVNFKMALQEYENALRRERKAEAMHMAYEKTLGGSYGAEGTGEGAAAAGAPGGDSLTPPSSGGGPALPAVSKLTLKEGEKIHVKLKGAASKDGGTRRGSGHGLSGRKAPPPGALVGKGGLLLKKPPPAEAGDGGAAAAAPTATTTAATKTTGTTDGTVEQDGSSSSPEETVQSKQSSTKTDDETASAEAAAPSNNVESELGGEDDNEEDEWGDFEDGTSS